MDDPLREQTGTLRTGVILTFAEYDLSMPRCLNLGPPLKLLGLLELLSKLWKTIFPEEFILGLSTETPLLVDDDSPAGLRIGLRPALAAADGGWSTDDLCFTTRILGGGGLLGLRWREIGMLVLGLSESSEWRGRSSCSWPPEEEEERERREEERETDSQSESFRSGNESDEENDEDDDNDNDEDDHFELLWRKSFSDFEEEDEELVEENAAVLLLSALGLLLVLL